MCTTLLGSIPILSQISTSRNTYDKRKAIAAAKLALEAYRPFKEQFPALEYPPAFSLQGPYYSYEEGGALYPILTSWVEIGMPVQEVLSDYEERRLGESGIMKPQVGRVMIRGKCSANCAKIDLEKIVVLSNDGKKIWEYIHPGRA